MRRLLIDCTRTVRANLHTGIQRVVRQTLYAASALAARGEAVPVVPVVCEHGRFTPLAHLAPHPFEGPRRALAVSAGTQPPGPGDVLLLADAAWYVDDIAPAIRRARNGGACVVPVVHDLISIQHPEWFDTGVGARFAAYLEAVLPLAGMAVCVSRATREALYDWLRGHADPSVQRLAATLPCQVNHPGADGVDAALAVHASPAVRAAFAREDGETCVIQVGSIEPRKQHALVLDAFEQAWESGATLRLVLIGSHGWKTAGFAGRVARHPELGRRLFHLQRVADADLAWAYRSADASVHASAIEGFGLPVAESGHHGMPVLLSDTPIHREVGGPLASYFPQHDAAALAGLLESLAGERRAEREFEPGWAIAAGHRGWAQSTRALLQLLARADRPGTGTAFRSDAGTDARTDAEEEPECLPL
ncbi:glycosyltransferase family 1 protein [Cupriavidus necator]|uniref:Glycosyltransferase family 1 protein n=1 Tax=Cupriavidus necator TaxID=106590 RepID=A0A1U9UVN2_CUPNE|nr:glycosyltransferase family 1 protein [Cupriavidus necator]AQV96487.1 glycosyltransferase family 1 protein [Cupriavidus necator]